MSDVVPPLQWISSTVLAILASAVNVLILMTELKKRKYMELEFTTNSLRILSIMTIIFGTLYSMVTVMSYLPFFCVFSNSLQYSLMANTMVFLGLYQLSRMSYCFSRSTAHSNRAYPNWLFVVMYSVGIMLSLSGWILPPFFAAEQGHFVDFDCGINDKLQYFPRGNLLSQHPLATHIVIACNQMYLVWDVVTLLLYVFKIQSLRKHGAQHHHHQQHQDGYNRILCILRRIIILTLFYEITSVLCTVTEIASDAFSNEAFSVLRAFAYLMQTVMANYSMFLMQHHNEHEYRIFLRMLYRLKVPALCICGCFTLKMDEMIERVHSTSTRSTKVEDVNDTVFETRDNPLPQHIPPAPELSQPTMDLPPRDSEGTIYTLSNSSHKGYDTVCDSEKESASNSGGE